MTNNDSTANAVGVVDAYGQALQARDKDTILRLYADESEIIPEAAPSLRGTDAIDSFYTDTFAAIGFEGDLQVVSAEVHDEIALVRSEQPIVVVAVADGTRTKTYYRELFVLRHTPDGWRIHKYMFSQNPAQA
ncbi:nuclear transport factor 2 family protein [Streptomyces sp. NBC_01231]|nr:nuclear transport factor 2 family protein [Streptomyces sp. NBC_01231]